MLEDERSSWIDGAPRSYRTYRADGFVVEIHDFRDAFEKVRKTHLTPSIQWTSIQILLRTLWTKVIALDSLQKEMILDSEVNADPFLTYPLLVMKVPWWMSST